MHLPYRRNGEAFSQGAKGIQVASAELDDLLSDRWLQVNPTHTSTIDEVRR